MRNGDIENLTWREVYQLGQAGTEWERPARPARPLTESHQNRIHRIALLRGMLKLEIQLHSAGADIPPVFAQTELAWHRPPLCKQMAFAVQVSPLSASLTFQPARR